MAINLRHIKEGWLNQLDYNSLSQEKKDLINKRAPICMGTKDDLSDRCEHFVYSPLYKMIENAVMVPKRIIAWVHSLGMHDYIDDPHGELEKKVELQSTSEVLGAQGFKCGKCGCDFGAGVSSPDYHCPLNKW